MRVVNFGIFISALGATLLAAVPTLATTAPPPVIKGWQVVIDNGYNIPTDACNPENLAACRKFNSYNPPSVNAGKLVVIRARSKGAEGGGQQPVHGIYTRDMAVAESPVVRILDRSSPVPQPNNLDATFIEPPAFPRIDMYSGTIATRGNHQPVWVENGDRFGTTGIYANPVGTLITGASKLGIVQSFSFFQVPDAIPLTPFDVFPGAPAVTKGTTIVFKGNYTENSIAKTGVYYRNLSNASAGGAAPVELIANTNNLIPGTTKIKFGSLAPPSAAGDKAVFVGLDNEDNPQHGGIYLVTLSPEPQLKTVITIGSNVPGESGATFNKFGEGLSFDGRFVAFWGAWGNETRSLNLQCPAEGNKDRVAYCKKLCAADSANCIRTVPVHQGIFVHDLVTGITYPVAKTGEEFGDFSDFLYWNFSGHVPGSTMEDDGEPARWRSSAFVAVSGLVDGSLADKNFHAAFKARKVQAVEGAPVDGIYLSEGPVQSPLLTLAETGMDGSLLDPALNGQNLPVTEMGIERDGFRGNALAINVTMGSEETGWGGVYLTEVWINLSSQISSRSTGFLYSRVSRQFTGRLTITNNGADINGKVVVVLNGLTEGVTLVNATGQYNGSPLITVSTSGLAAGASITVPLQFTDPANAKINFTTLVLQP
ncbi:MAG: hypothetical protein ACP5SH_02770 [Syntrophobacteraceae bacterium]